MIRQMHTWGTSDWLVGRALGDFRAEDWRARPEGMSSALWILGHLLIERQWLGRLLGIDIETHERAAFFEGGTKPDDLPNDLDGSALLEAFHEVHKRFVEHLEGLDEAALQEPIEEEFPSSPRTRLGALQFMLLHECYHIGQLGALRVMLGKGSWMDSLPQG